MFCGEYASTVTPAAYLSLKLDDPSFTAPIYANLFDDEGGEGYTLLWSPSSGVPNLHPPIFGILSGSLAPCCPSTRRLPVGRKCSKDGRDYLSRRTSSQEPI
jgi:Protein of unknown function (DUF736)